MMDYFSIAEDKRQLFYMDKSTKNFTHCSDSYLLECLLCKNSLSLTLYQTQPNSKINQETYAFETLPNMLNVFFTNIEEVFDELLKENYLVDSQNGRIQLHLENNINGRIAKNKIAIPLYTQTFLEGSKAQEVELKIAKQLIKKEKQRGEQHQAVIIKMSGQIKSLKQDKNESQNKLGNLDKKLDTLLSEVQKLLSEMQMIKKTVKNQTQKMPQIQQPSKADSESNNKILDELKTTKQQIALKANEQTEAFNKKLNEQIKFVRNDFEDKLIFWRSLWASKMAHLFDIQLTNHKITYKGQKGWTQLVHSKGFNQKRQSTIKILKITNGALGFGVIDTSYRENRYSNSNEDHPNRIVNISNRIFEAGNNVKSPEKKFKAGDIVTIKVQNGHISWMIGNQLQAEYVCDRLKDAKIEWVPYILMYHPGDQILWTQ